MAAISCQISFLVLFCVLLTIKAAENQESLQYCPFFNNRAPSAQPNLKNCTWYKENSCCLQQEIEATFGSVKPLKGASQSCQKLINFLMCYVCAPNQNLFYKNERLKVCESFCDELFDACNSAILKGSHIKDLYSSGKEFCLSRRFLVDSEACFAIDHKLMLNKSSRLNCNLNTLLTVMIIFVLSKWITTRDSVFPWQAETKSSHRHIRCPVKMIYAAVKTYIVYVCVCVFPLHFMVASAETQSSLTESNVLHLAEELSLHFAELARVGLSYENLQTSFDESHHSTEYINGTREILKLRSELREFFSEKEEYANDLASKIQRMFDTSDELNFTSLEELPTSMCRDADFLDLNEESNCDYDSKYKARVCLDQSVVKVADNVDRSDGRVIDTVHWSAQLDPFFKRNRAADSSIRWQYFGSTHGILRTYPGREWNRNFVGFTEDFDPRTRPWYISVTSSPKDVIIILDVSSSMATRKRLDRLKAVTRNVLMTLTKLDRVSVVLSRSPYWMKNGDYVDKREKVLGCGSSTLLPATTSHVQHLLSLLHDVTADGGSDHLPAFQKAFSMLKGAGGGGTQACKSVVIFVTDGQSKDTFENRCDKGYLRYKEDSTREYVPGQLCVYDYDDFQSHIDNLQHTLKHPAHMFTFLVDKEDMDTHDFAAQMSCLHNGVFVKVKENDDVIGQMRSYYEYLGMSSGVRQTEWTSPYLDKSGLGMMMTVSAAVYSNVTGRHIGVVGIDVPLVEVENIIRRASWGNVYGFLVDRNDLTAVFHPFLKPPVQLTADPIFVPVSEIETHSSKPHKFSDVLHAIANGQTGSVAIETDAMRVVSKDESLSWQPVDYIQYVYTDIPDTDLAIVLNIGASDETITHKQSPPQPGHMTSSRDGSVSYLHDMELYKEYADNLPGVYEQLQPTRNNSRYPEIEISTSHSVVKLAPRAFCHPGKFLDENNPDFVEMHGFINTYDRRDEIDCPLGVYAPDVKADVQLTADLEAAWMSRDVQVRDHVVWTYVGTSSGIMRIYPGVRMRKEYDPTLRDWYLRTLANDPSTLTLSSIYTDAIPNIGKVVTLSKAIRAPMPKYPSTCTDERRELGCSCDSHDACTRGSCIHGYCTSNSIQAVVAMDIRYSDFHARVLEIGNKLGIAHACGAQYPCNGHVMCETLCYIVTDTAHISFASNTSYLRHDDANSEQTTLTSVHGHVFSQLLERAVFVKNVRLDYQAVCYYSQEQPVQVDVAIETLQGESHWHYTHTYNTGPVPPFNNEYSCVKQVIYYTANSSALNNQHVISGSLQYDPCGHGSYFLTSIPGMNVFLLVLDNYRKSHSQINLNCQISNSVFAPGSFALEEEICEEQSPHITSRDRKCSTEPISYPCGYSHSIQLHITMVLPLLIAAVLSLVLLI